MSKKRLARIVGVCLAVVGIVVLLTAFPLGCQDPKTPPTHGLQFDGEEDHIALDSVFALGSFTVEAWMNHDTLEPQHGILLGDDLNQNWIRVTKHEVTLRMAGTVYNIPVSPSLSTGTWVHIAVTRHGTDCKVYLDGSHAGSVQVQATDTFSPVTIGGETSGNRFVHGIIADVRVWNVARSESEIKAQMYKELGGAESGLMGYWKLDEGSGITAVDSTANNNNGVLRGNPVWVEGG